MIKREDINRDNYPELPDVSLNINVLVERLNLLIHWGCPITRITSGLRSVADQKRINPAAMRSKHLTGAAADCYDPERKIANWCKDNLQVLEDVQLWCEDFGHTPTWVHFQCLPPKSGRRVFLP